MADKPHAPEVGGKGGFSGEGEANLFQCPECDAEHAFPGMIAGLDPALRSRESLKLIWCTWLSRMRRRGFPPPRPVILFRIIHCITMNGLSKGGAYV